MIAARWSSATEVASHNILPISVDLPSSTEPQVRRRHDGAALSRRRG